MANDFVRPTILAIDGSDSPDVVGYLLYMVDSDEQIIRELDGTVLGAQVFDLGKPDISEDNKIRFNLAALPNMTTNDGVYNLGVAAIDGSGNESSFMIMEDIPLDFVAPNAPSGGIIERS